MGKIVCFGEIMLRLAPFGYERFEQAKSFEVIYGGGEANVAVSLANFGLDSRYITKLPVNAIGRACRNELRKFGVDTTKIAWGGDRLGIYFIEKGASMRPSNVIYDRAGSSIATAAPGDFDWEEIFHGAEWFHFSGISPALGENVTAIVTEACKAAHSKGIKISCDVNYRKKLWSREKAGQVMGALLGYVDLLVNPSDLFDMKECPTIEEVELEFRRMAEMIKDRYGIKYTAFSIRESISASDNGLYGLLYDGSEFYKSRHYDMHIVDRVGGGDAFTSGLIYGLLNGFSGQWTVEFGTAASALKHTIEGDANMVTVEEVNTLAGGDASGKVQR